MRKRRLGYRLRVHVLCGPDHKTWRLVAKDFELPFPPWNGLSLIVGKDPTLGKVGLELMDVSFDPEDGTFSALEQQDDVEDADFYLEIGFRELPRPKLTRHGRPNLQLLKPPKA